MIRKEIKDQIIKEYATHEGDTGSPEVQVAVLTYRINELGARGNIRPDTVICFGIIKIVFHRIIPYEDC